MLYLPGTEGGNAVVDVLTQKVQMTGTLPMPYYSSVDQIGTSECWHDIGWNAYKG
jgi:beta-glucosidase